MKKRFWFILIIIATVIAIIIGAIIGYCNAKQVDFLFNDIFWAAVGAIGTIVSIIAAIIVYHKNYHKEQIANTVKAFPELRSLYPELYKRLINNPNLEDKEIDLELKKYMTAIEHFAVGVNMGAFDIEVVNRMSGSMLVRQYELYIETFIKKHRAQHSGKYTSEKSIYKEYEIMMHQLNKIRKKAGQSTCPNLT